ncbi:MAG: cupin fold metalloprotein, WbuC family, partial [Lentimicrobiaceae bacterium]
VHKHDHTAETYVLLSGSTHIPAGQIHSLEVLEPGTVIFECKDGPYMPI